MPKSGISVSSERRMLHHVDLFPKRLSHCTPPPETCESSPTPGVVVSFPSAALAGVEQYLIAQHFFMRLWTIPLFSCAKYLFRSALLCAAGQQQALAPDSGQRLTDASPPRGLALPASRQGWIPRVGPRHLGAKPAHLLVTTFIHSPPQPPLCSGNINGRNRPQV